MKKKQEPTHKTKAEEEFGLPPLFQMNDMVLTIAINYAHRELETTKGRGGDIKRVKRKISLLEKEKRHRGLS